jgi:hypothetical protein
MAGFRIEGNTSGNIAEINSANELQVDLTALSSSSGFVTLTTEVDAGAATGVRTVRNPEVSINKRLRVGVDGLLFQDVFSYAAQNSAVWANNLTTMTVTFATGFMSLNGGSSTASGAVARVSTYKFFPLINGAGLSLEIDAILTQVPQTNNVVELGCFQAAGTTAPTDGFLFRYTSAGNLIGVVNYGGTETTTGNFSLPTANVTHSYLIRAEQEEVSFWIDGVLQGKITTPNNAAGPCQAMYQPITFRNYNSAITSAAQVLKVGEVRLFIRDLDNNRDWYTALAGMGNHGSQGQAGGTMGSTALFTNSLAPGAGAAATNTTAALGSGLGGQFALQPTLTANTDGIISSYQIPAGSATVPGKSLIIKGIRINGIVTTTFTGGPVYAVWSLAYGHTSVSLATAEGAATKAPRRIPLGIQTFVVTAPVGTQDSRDINIVFQTPVVVNPGEFVQTVMKNVGTVTSAGVITWTIMIDAVWE